MAVGGESAFALDRSEAADTENALRIYIEPAHTP